MKSEHCSSGELQGYLDRELSADATQRVEEHLEVCLQCRNVFKVLSRIDSALVHLPLESVGSEFTRSLVNHLSLSPKTPFAFRIFEIIPYVFALLTVVAITLCAFMITDVLDEGMVSASQIAAGELLAEVGSATASIGEDFTRWLKDYVPFAFGKGSLGITIVVSLVLALLAVVDRIYTRRVGH